MCCEGFKLLFVLNSKTRPISCLSIQEGEPQMPNELIKLFIQRFDNMFNIPDLSIADELFAPHFIAHFPLTPRMNLSNFKNFMQGFYAAFPDFRQEVHDSILTNARLVLRVTYYGTHQGDFMGIPATGREVTMHGISIFQIENGLIVENWTEIDVFGVVQQISAVPSIDYKSIEKSSIFQLTGSHN